MLPGANSMKKKSQNELLLSQVRDCFLLAALKEREREGLTVNESSSLFWKTEKCRLIQHHPYANAVMWGV